MRAPHDSDRAAAATIEGRVAARSAPAVLAPCAALRDGPPLRRDRRYALAVPQSRPSCRRRRRARTAASIVSPAGDGAPILGAPAAARGGSDRVVTGTRAARQRLSVRGKPARGTAGIVG